MVRVPEPADGDERHILLGWLAFQRDALDANCRDLDRAQLATRSAEPSVLSLLGIVRHMAEMERVYGSWSLGPDDELTMVWGEYVDGGPDWDFAANPDQLEESMTAWRVEQAATDARIATYPSLDGIGPGNRRSARWNLHKLCGEYARHNGHADILRERVDGTSGE